jgi:hypothetical protein
MNEKFIEKCFELLKRDDIKSEMKEFVRPIIDLILQELYPYIYLSILFVLISFLLILGIFLLLLRNKNFKYE